MNVDVSQGSALGPFRITPVAAQRKVFKPTFHDGVQRNRAGYTGFKKAPVEDLRIKSYPSELDGILRKASRKLPVVQYLSPFKPFHVLVLGGGISGLVAAYTLQKRIKWPCRITLLEESGRVGGWIHSGQFSSGGIFERGTRSIRPAGKVGRNTLSLISDLGLEDQIIVSSKERSKKRCIYVNGKVIELPSSLLGLCQSIEPLNHALMPKLIRETMLQAGKSQDTTVFDFFKRRFGEKVATYLGDAFCMGIYGCSSKKLGIQACFPKLWEYEQSYGSVVLGALLSPSDQDDAYNHPLCQRARKEGWSSWSLQSGLEDFPKRLHQVLLEQRNTTVDILTKCESLELTPNRQWICTTKSDIFVADHVMSAIPSFKLASLLKVGDTDLSAKLEKINWTTMGVVNVEFDHSNKAPRGFGILTPGCEGREVLGIVYDSMVFPEQDKNPNARRYTVMLGGDRFESFFGNPKDCKEETLVEIALKELKVMHGVQEKPQNCVSVIHEQCIPQYGVGHLATVEAIESTIRRRGIPLTVIGNSYRGVSVNDVIYNTQTVVENFVRNVNDQQLRLGCL